MQEKINIWYILLGMIYIIPKVNPKIFLGIYFLWESLC
jgi:hypothetical protein